MTEDQAKLIAEWRRTSTNLVRPIRDAGDRLANELTRLLAQPSAGWGEAEIERAARAYNEAQATGTPWSMLGPQSRRFAIKHMRAALSTLSAPSL